MTAGGKASLKPSYLVAVLFFIGISLLTLLGDSALSHPLQRCIRQSPSLPGRLLGRQMLEQVNYHTVL